MASLFRGKLGLIGLVIVATALFASGGGQAGAANAGYPIPLPSGPGASPSLCETYFGSPATIAKEFGVKSLIPTKITDYSNDQKYVGRALSFRGSLTCAYRRLGPKGDHSHSSADAPLNLELSTDNDESISGVCCMAFAQAGKVFAYVETGNPTIQIPENVRPWLHMAATRAVPPR